MTWHPVVAREELHGEVTEPSDADDHRGAPRHQQVTGPVHGAVGRERAVGQRGGHRRPEVVGQRHQVPGVGNQHQLGHAAVGAEPTDRGTHRHVAAVVLVPLCTLVAPPAAPRAVHRHGLADLHVGDAGPEGVHPSRRSRAPA